MGIFSFDHYKTITTGEGGMIVTDDLDLYHRAEWYHDHGHDHLSTVNRAMEGRTILGFNYRMNEIQGGIGIAQLRKLNWVLAAAAEEQGRHRDVPGPGPGSEIPGSARSRRAIRRRFWPSTCRRRKRRRSSRRPLPTRGSDTVCFKDNLWHYVPNWEHFLAKSTAQKQSAFTDPRNRKVTYSRKEIPQAEDLLGRTLVLGVNVKMSAAALKDLGKKIEKAAQAL